MQRVVIGPAPLAGLTGSYLDLLAQAGLQAAFPAKRAQMKPEDMLRELAGTRYVLAGSEPYTPEILDQLPELKLIARAGVGYDAVNVPAATERGIVVTNAPGSNAEAVAEHVFLLMLSLTRDLLAQDRETRAGRWPRRAVQPLRGKTLGILGLGHVGKQVAKRAVAFGVPVLAHDIVPDATFAKAHQVTLVGFEELLERSDILTVHTPLDATTENLLDATALARLKPSAFLINAARGGIVNEADLYTALSTGKLAGAGIDVFEEEPLPGTHPLASLANVVLTAHIAGVDRGSILEMGRMAAECIVRFHAGDWPTECVVNPEVRRVL